MELALAPGFSIQNALERREFFALGFAGVDRKPARRKTIQLALGDSPEVARAEKDANLVIIVGAY